MFTCLVHVVSINEYSIIWVNTNLTCLLNALVMSTNLSDFIEAK